MTKHLISKFDSLPLSISSLVDITFSTSPKRPSNTNLCVFVPSKVPVRPILYLAFVQEVSIVVRDCALNRCASSPMI